MLLKNNWRRVEEDNKKKLAAQLGAANDESAEIVMITWGTCRPKSRSLLWQNALIYQRLFLPAPAPPPAASTEIFRVLNSFSRLRAHFFQTCF